MNKVFSVSGFDSKTSMRCYSEKTGPKYQICDKSFGFQTCFTKYDDSKCTVLKDFLYLKYFQEGTLCLEVVRQREKCFMWNVKVT